MYISCFYLLGWSSICSLQEATVHFVSNSISRVLFHGGYAKGAAQFLRFEKAILPDNGGYLRPIATLIFREKKYSL